jgi:hypothetical protein
MDAFYALRSAAVHGTHRLNTTDHDTSEQGLKICGEVLQAVVNLKGIPDWKSFELGAGPTTSMT